MHKLTLLVLCSSAYLASALNAAVVYFTINLDGRQAGTVSSATGTGTAALDTNSRLLSWNISFTGLQNGTSSVTEASFHHGPQGITGAVITPPGNVMGTGKSPIVGSAAISTADKAGFPAGGVYFILNTTAYPAGEIRGQLIPQKVEIGAQKDNTIFEYIPPQTPTSNGKGPLLIVGTNNSNEKRRALLMFDIAASGIPAGSIITSSTLRLYNIKNTIDKNCETKLYRLVKDWGEGTSSVSQDSGGAPATPGDATWLHNFYPSSFWTKPGGDFSNTLSASLIVPPAAGFYFWTSEIMADDVQRFLDEPSSNFGWMMAGDETQVRDKKYFASLQNTTAAYRPLLTVTYTPPCLFDLIGDLNNDCRADSSDLEFMADIWLADCTNPAKPCYDLNQDNITNLVEFAAIASTWLTDCDMLPVNPQCIPK